MSGVEIVLLCEDQQTNSFVRNFLKHRNFKSHDITTLPLPASRGAGEKWVRERYPKQLKAIRDRRNKLRNIRNKKYVYLIVVIDADTHTLDYRHQQLKQECEKNHNHIPPRNSSDTNVLHIIPRRNIETWLAYLKNDKNENVDESKDYKKIKCLRDCQKKDLKEYAENLYDMCHVHQQLRKPAPASLREACGEYRRLRRRN